MGCKDPVAVEGDILGPQAATLEDIPWVEGVDVETHPIRKGVDVESHLLCRHVCLDILCV